MRLIRHELVNVLGSLLHRRLLANDVEEGCQGLVARLRGLASALAALIFHAPLGPTLGDVLGYQAVGCVAKYIVVRDTAPRLLTVTDVSHPVTEECRSQADHVALAVTDDSDGYIGLLLSHRLHQLGKSMRGKHIVWARRTSVHITVVGWIQMLDMHPEKQRIVKSLAPQVGQRGAAIGERTTAPIIILVQVQTGPVVLQVLAIGLVTPTKLNDRRKIFISFNERFVVHVGIDKSIIR